MTELNKLVKISERAISSDNKEPTVNARELHAFLDSKQQFADWIKKRIADYGFIEGSDYVKFELSADLKMAESGGDISEILASQKNEALKTTGCKSFGQQGRIEYAITLDMAKELSMVERNAKGKEARQYFIACEKQLREQSQKPKSRYNLAFIERAMMNRAAIKDGYFSVTYATT